MAGAVTGETENLAWVSPRTGRAATYEAGAPHKDVLLRLPPFLVDAEAELQSGDVADAFALAGYFLERRVFEHKGEGMPDPRRRLIELEHGNPARIVALAEALGLYAEALRTRGDLSRHLLIALD